MKCLQQNLFSQLSLTFVNAWVALLKVDDGGELFDTDLLGEAGVVRLDELDSDGVRVVVDLLQGLDVRRAPLAAVGI